MAGSETNTDKTDVVLMLQLSSKYDLKDLATAKKVQAYVSKQERMQSSFGKIYKNRLNEIVNEQCSSDQLCLLCKKEKSEDGIICSECMDKYSGGKLRVFSQKEISNTKLRNAYTETSPETKVFCRSCGAELHGSVCEKCGAKRGEGYDFCSCCGNKVPIPDINTSNPDSKVNSPQSSDKKSSDKKNDETEEKKSHPLVGIIAIIIVIFIIGKLFSCGGCGQSGISSSQEKESIDLCVAELTEEYARSGYLDATFKAEVIGYGKKPTSDRTGLIVAVQPTYREIDWEVKCYHVAILGDGKPHLERLDTVTLYKSIDEINDDDIADIKKMMGFVE